jgi:FAD dependent oxidoreductase
VWRRGPDAPVEPRRTSAIPIWRHTPYGSARSEAQIAEIEKEVEIAKRLGLPAAFARDVPLPFTTAGAIRLDDQAQFNPYKYCLGLARAVAGGGGLVFEGTRARSVAHGKPCRVTTDRGVITARDVIDASHMPFGKEGVFFTKAYPYAHGGRGGEDRPGQGAFGHVHQCRDAQPLRAHGPLGRRGVSDRRRRSVQAPAGHAGGRLKQSHRNDAGSKALPRSQDRHPMLTCR